MLQVLKSDNNMRNSDVELQQRSIEYLQLSSIATQDVLVCRTLVTWTLIQIIMISLKYAYIRLSKQNLEI